MSDNLGTSSADCAAANSGRRPTTANYFAIVCIPEAHADMAAFAERVADNIEQARLRLTADITGTATVRWIFWDHDEDAEQFMRRADVELHDAKTLRDAALPVA